MGTDPSGSDRLARVNRWIVYYSGLQEKLGFQNIFLSDDGSEKASLDQLEGDVWVFENRHLGKRNNANGVDYDYCWRALWDIRKLIEIGYKKIITIDTDTFVLSERLFDYIRERSTGWTAFDIEKYHFPSAELHILCEDAFPRFLYYTRGDFMQKNGTLMEKDIPFTHVICGFKVDRFGEERLPQTPDMDAYAQAPLDIDLRYVPRTP
jgi:hypothetical protein